MGGGSADGGLRHTGGGSTVAWQAGQAAEVEVVRGGSSADLFVRALVACVAFPGCRHASKHGHCHVFSGATGKQPTTPLPCLRRSLTAGPTSPLRKRKSKKKSVKERWSIGNRRTCRCTSWLLPVQCTPTRATTTSVATLQANLRPVTKATSFGYSRRCRHAASQAAISPPRNARKWP